MWPGSTRWQWQLRSVDGNKGGRGGKGGIGKRGGGGYLGLGGWGGEGDGGQRGMTRGEFGGQQFSGQPRLQKGGGDWVGSGLSLITRCNYPSPCQPSKVVMGILEVYCTLVTQALRFAKKNVKTGVIKTKHHLLNLHVLEWNIVMPKYIKLTLTPNQGQPEQTLSCDSFAILHGDRDGHPRSPTYCLQGNNWINSIYFIERIL